MKTTDKYEEYKKRKADEQRTRRQKKKELEDEMPIAELRKVLDDRRRGVRERTKKYRERKNNPLIVVNEPKQSYSNSATLGKAVAKAKKSLPNSPSKKNAVLFKLLNDVQNEDQIQLPNEIDRRTNKPQYLELAADIRMFFERDDVSVASPKVNDVKKYVSDSGEQIFLPTRHMTLTLKESYGLFINERENMGKGDFWVDSYKQYICCIAY